jgi:hypothetical protein
MNIIDTGTDEASARKLAAYYARHRRRGDLLIRRLIRWDVRKSDPERAQQLADELKARYTVAARSYMRLL